MGLSFFIRMCYNERTNAVYYTYRRTVPLWEVITMSENTRKKIIKRKKKEQPRQNWKPHWVPNTLYHIWCALFSVFKVAAVAAITVALVVVVCAFVLVGRMGNYLQDDILTAS